MRSIVLHGRTVVIGWENSLWHDLGSVGLVAAIEVQVEAFGLDRLDEVHVGTDEGGHDCGCLLGFWFVREIGWVLERLCLRIKSLLAAEMAGLISLVMWWEYCCDGEFAWVDESPRPWSMLRVDRPWALLH
jgi:hypothetical protein